MRLIWKGQFNLANGSNILVVNLIHMVNYKLCGNVMEVWVRSILVVVGDN
jgi:hypothetical protein